MSGLLRSEGWRIGENQVGRSIKRVHPLHLQYRRTEANRHMNPHTYIAHYFGQKLHIDQNEKNIMFGVVHILAIDGYSSKIVSLVSMPRKNCDYLQPCVPVSTILKLVYFVQSYFFVIV